MIQAPASLHKSLKQLSQFLKENVAIPFTLTKGGKVVSEATHKMEVKQVEDFSFEKSEMQAKGTEALSVEPSIPLDADVADEVLKNYDAAQEMDSAAPQFDGNMESSYAGDLERKDELWLFPALVRFNQSTKTCVLVSGWSTEAMRLNLNS